MENFIVVFKNSSGDLYVSGKTDRMMGKTYEKLVADRIKAKFYNNKKVAQNKANKLNNGNLYSGEFVVESLITKIVIK